jgi:hypothetical protein
VHLVGDRRGAMMVMGVFVSVFLVGALWSIAGLGEAVVMRERMQEASDATALAAAMIDARAMNVMVLFNLIMASILSIRVLLNGLYIAALLVWGVFTALAAIPLVGLAFGIIAAAALVMSQVINGIRHEVDDQISTSLAEFDAAMAGIAKETPALAMNAGGVPALYSPPLVAQQPEAATGASVSPGAPLPVTLGSPDSLCDRALNALSTEVDDIVAQSQTSLVAQAVGKIFDAAIPFVTSVIEGSGFLYNDLCELGGTQGLVVGGAVTPLGDNCNAQSIDVGGGNLQSAQPQSCVDSQPGGTDEKAVQTAIAADAGTAAIQAAQDQLTSDQDACNQFSQACSSKTQQQASAPPPAVGITASNPNTQPFVVDNAFFANGGPLAQIFTDVLMDPASPMVSFAPQFVTVAARGQVNAGPPPQNWNHSFSQAEFFYDCTDAWSVCNSNDDAMWNYYWRARLRTFSVQAAQDAQTIGTQRCNFIISKGATCSLDDRQATVVANVAQASNQVIERLQSELAGTTSEAQQNLLRDVDKLAGGQGPSLVVH